MQITQTYSRPSTAQTDAKGTHFNLSAELSRSPVSLHAMVNNSMSYARLMLALRKVVVGNWRGGTQDHSQYQEWVKKKYLEELPLIYADVQKEQEELLAKKKEIQSKIKAINQIVQPIQSRMWKARSKYRNYLYQHEREKWRLLDPVISVHPDCVIFEAFSLDESSYGRLSVPMENLETFGNISYGTTNIDFSQALADEIYRVRSYRPAWLKVAYEQVELSTNTGARVERKIDLPESWVRGFLQVQSASTLPGTIITLSATTMNEIVAILARKKAKVSPRSLRFVLKKGQYPTISIDPWGISIREAQYVYNGAEEGEIRIWGRRRLSVFEDVLPYAEKVQVKLLGTGMPSYWSMTMEGHRFDVGLSGWTSNDWAQKASFDLLASTGNQKDINLKKVEQKLIEQLAGTPAAFATWLNIPQSQATHALQELCKKGQAMYDPLTTTYRWRQLLQADIQLQKSEANERNQYAIQLFNEAKVSIVNREWDKSLHVYELEVQGKHLFKPKISLDGDGRVRRAACNCGFFRHNKLRKGPCSHIVAATLEIGKGK